MKKKCDKCGLYKENIYRGGDLIYDTSMAIHKDFVSFLIRSAKKIQKNAEKNKNELNKDDAFLSLKKPYDTYYDYRDWPDAIERLEGLLFNGKYFDV